MLILRIARKLGFGNRVDAYVQNVQRKEHAAQIKNETPKLKAATKKRNKPKIFVIGFNKTGTTSVHSAALEFDLIVGNQRTAEWLLDDIIAEQYESLFDYCETAEMFQDAPFSFPNIYKKLDLKFPNSKFILTVRDSDEQWFNSLTKFHGKLWAKEKVPTKEDLAAARYVYKGYALKAINYLFGAHYYNKEIYSSVYNKHNQEVQAYFKDRPNDFLMLNVGAKESYQQFCAFIGEKPLRETFEWKNKTSNITIK